VRCVNAVRGIKETHAKHYEEVGLNKAIDLRWKRKLTRNQLEAFELIAGKLVNGLHITGNLLGKECSSESMELDNEVEKARFRYRLHLGLL